MSDKARIKEFPDIGNKLAAPTKKSVFERQKAEAEAKRQREEAETAAVYEDFVKSFEDHDGPSTFTSRDRQPGGAGGGFGAGRGGNVGGPPKRQFAGPPPTGPAGRGGASGSRMGFSSTGPGSLGAPPPPPPPSLSRKRAHDGSLPVARDGTQGLFAFDDPTPGAADAKGAFPASDDEDDAAQEEKKAERAAPKPTLHLSSLPPGTSPAAIKALLPPGLTVDAVRILPPSGPGSMERKSLSAIVTLAKDTPANEIEAAVSGLQNHYLGWGYNLSISRHLSSAALRAGAPLQAGATSALSSLPFGAKPVHVGPASHTPGGPGGRHHHRGGYAPPITYGPSAFGRGAPPVQIMVKPPSDLKELKLIHKTLESLLTHGPEFEVLLMSRPEVQRNERWAWIWDPRSTGGVWYRWRLWQILSAPRGGGGYTADARRGMPQYVFAGGAAWAPPRTSIRFEHTTYLDEFVSDSQYDSSEDDDSGDEGPRASHLPESGPGEVDQGAVTYLNPLQKAKLTHLLARLPTSNARLRKGDVAQVTAFAISHAGEGADEVVDVIIANIEQPFAVTSANPHHTKDIERSGERDEEVGMDEKDASKEMDDTSPAKLVGLYLVSDILSSSSTSGVRHAWRYRQLFEVALKQRKVFEGLGRLEKTLHWGRLRAEKWKRSVGSVLSLWEGWCVFPQASQDHFTAVFANPPPTVAEQAALAAAQRASGAGEAAKSRWKTVDVAARAAENARVANLKEDATVNEVDSDGDVDGEAMMSDEDVDGEPMEDVDGEPMEHVDGEPMDTTLPDETRQPDGPLPSADQGHTRDAVGMQSERDGDITSVTGPRRRRPKAEDMFAVSDGE
ncbi:MAG: hypothetical protein M1838_005931 [Thelocarpon superellum]|nr:MAG: hypothetical protein M1838_005931 [Thelocarpon superellum]